jgi:hypothetical protein
LILCLRQDPETAKTVGDARLRAGPEPQARAAAAARTEANGAPRKNNAMLAQRTAQPGAHREVWAARAAPPRSAGRHVAAPVKVPAERGRSVSGATAAPVAESQCTGAPACGQRGARVRETGPAYTLYGRPGHAATPAPPPLYARADALWPRAKAWGKVAARTGGEANRPTAGAAPAAAAAE